MTTVVASSRPTSFWIIATLALVWNLIGVCMFYLQMTSTPAQLAAMPVEQRQILEATPSCSTPPMEWPCSPAHSARSGC